MILRLIDMMSPETMIEAILFAVAKPLPISTLSKTLSLSLEETQEAVNRLKTLRNTDESGIWVMDQAGSVLLVTHAGCKEVLRAFVKEDLGSELTRPALETLTLIVYRGPITKPELEQVRGVNCSMILRNLLQRDLIVEETDAEKLQPSYQASETLLRHLGVASVSDLPSYDVYAHHPEIDQLLGELQNEEV